MELFVLKDGTSDKFWEIDPQIDGDGVILIIRFGRIGTKGQTKRIRCTSDVEAAAEIVKRKGEKTRKGYVSASWPLPESGMPAAIEAIQIGEHREEIAKHVAAWLTECLQKKMTPSYFKKIWEYRFEGEVPDGEDEATLDKVPEETPEGDFWEDMIEDSYSFPKMYAKAVRNHADRFVTLDDNSFVSIVAVCGDPGAEAIEKCVVESKNLLTCIMAGDSKWPPEIGPGVPIQHLELGEAPACIVTLRDGKEVRIDIPSSTR